MKRSIKILITTIAALTAGCLVILFAIQLILQRSVPANPPVLAEPAWDSPSTRAAFMTVCGDCHSNETRWPWYSRVPPASLLILNHVREGREKFNVSEWNRPENEGDEAYELYKDGIMPPANYLSMHPEARLAPTAREAFLQGLLVTFGSD